MSGFIYLTSNDIRDVAIIIYGVILFLFLEW